MQQERAKYDLGPDGKVIVTCHHDEVERISLSLHHKTAYDSRDLFRLAREIACWIGLDDLDGISVNGGETLTSVARGGTMVCLEKSWSWTRTVQRFQLVAVLGRAKIHTRSIGRAD